ncbi:carbohydrate-binding protein [Achlya hypogyna]|uniref:Carbohydrate-binding protein n=1 Tax=Achlya hypogyna TaxID=1202772 RepID=A0A1V9YH29_ACHHY|nr:carbohydrate-binding protein [Achlya hypogyna]
MVSSEGAPVADTAIDTPTTTEHQIVVFAPPEVEVAGLYRVKAPPQRGSIWDGMVQLSTPVTEDAKIAAEAGRLKLIRRRIWLLLITVCVVVAAVVGLSVGLASQSHGATTGIGDEANAVDPEPTMSATPAPEATEYVPSPTSAENDTAEVEVGYYDGSSTTGQPSQIATTSLPTPSTSPAPTTPQPTTAAPTTVTPAPTPAPAYTQMLNFVNRCPYSIELYQVDTLICTLGTNGQYSTTLAVGDHTMFRHTRAAQATLVEMTLLAGKLWYDISIIPPGCGQGVSWSQCVAISGGQVGYNVPVSVLPTKYDNKPTAGNCHYVECKADQCPDAYLYPTDDLKMKDCPEDERFVITYCP